MNNAAIRRTGIGCFAGGTTLSRVFRRIMAACSLGDWGSPEGLQPNPSPAVRALQGLMADDRAPGLSARAPGDESVAGFFLNFEGQRFHVAVFTRSRGRPCQKYTASLEELMRLRPNRLH
jgi:hypothetical protein